MSRELQIAYEVLEQAREILNEQGRGDEAKTVNEAHAVLQELENENQ